jgi:hypothetical protein
VTEEADCMALIVSEETGKISIAAGGEIEMDVKQERLDERVSRHYGQRPRVRTETSQGVPVIVKQNPAWPPAQRRG